MNCQLAQELLNGIKKHTIGATVKVLNRYQSSKSKYDYEVIAYSHPAIDNGESVYFEVYKTGHVCMIFHDMLISVIETRVLKRVLECYSLKNEERACLNERVCKKR